MSLFLLFQLLVKENPEFLMLCKAKEISFFLSYERDYRQTLTNFQYCSHSFKNQIFSVKTNFDDFSNNDLRMKLSASPSTYEKIVSMMRL